MRKLAVSFVLFCITFFTSACDTGLEIINMSIDTYPNNIVYVKGNESEINLSGGTILLISKDGTETIEEMSNEYVEVNSTIDFNKPGVYVVTLKRGEFTCDFPVQVVDK